MILPCIGFVSNSFVSYYVPIKTNLSIFRWNLATVLEISWSQMNKQTDHFNGLGGPLKRVGWSFENIKFRPNVLLSLHWIKKNKKSQLCSDNCCKQKVIFQICCICYTGDGLTQFIFQIWYVCYTDNGLYSIFCMDFVNLFYTDFIFLIFLYF